MVEQAADSVNITTQRGLNSIIILGAWTLWRHRNDCVFNGVSPSLSTVLVMAGDEIRMWNMAGAKGLSLLTGYGRDMGDSHQENKGSVSAWKLLILVLSAQQNLQKAKAVADIAIDEDEKDDQLDILRLKAFRLPVDNTSLQWNLPRLSPYRNPSISSIPSVGTSEFRFSQADKPGPGLRQLDQGALEGTQYIGSILTILGWGIVFGLVYTEVFVWCPLDINKIGLQLEAQSLHQEALMAFSFPLSINPDYVSSMIWMVGILRKLGGNSLSIARTFLWNALRLDPTSHRAWMDLGLVLKSQGSLLEAADCF
ncbi:hypothetical protein EJB05_07672, partial [Eragrostis curvula]